MASGDERHSYPSHYPPGTHWATDAAWEILDTLKPGILSIEARSLLAGMIAGRLMKERATTLAECGAELIEALAAKE
jgi:hypothetical protein